MAIAIYGPRNKTIAISGAKRRSPVSLPRPSLFALELAIKEVNARGGYRGSTPFALHAVFPGYARYGWTLPEDDIVTFSAEPHVLGVVGYLETANRIADAVLFHAELPWLDVSPIPEAGGDAPPVNPWVFRCWGDQPRKHRLLLDHLFDDLRLTRVAALGTPDVTSKRHLAWWRSHAEARNRSLVADEVWHPGRDDLTRALAAIQRAKPDAVLTWFDKPTSKQVLRRMRDTGMTPLFVGGPAIVADDFAESIGADASPALALLSTDCGPPGGHFATFAHRYADYTESRRSPTSSTTDALRTFEATDHLAYAINVGGRSRESVRGTLRALFESAKGEAHYERLHGPSQATVARLTDGRWQRDVLTTK